MHISLAGYLAVFPTRTRLIESMDIDELLNEFESMGKTKDSKAELPSSKPMHAKKIPQDTMNDLDLLLCDINVSLNESIVDRSASIGFQQLLFKLQVADRHEKFLSWACQQGGCSEGGRFASFSE